jgi:single-strand DNA-binding protein
MQQLIGRITNNAKVNHLKDGREVTNFSIALNDSYKPKGSDEVTHIVTYVDCSYWISSKVAERLTKGSLVEVLGRIGMRIYKNSDGNAKSSLTLHVQTIKLHGQTKGSNAKEVVSTTTAAASEPIDDLPF